MTDAYNMNFSVCCANIKMTVMKIVLFLLSH